MFSQQEDPPALKKPLGITKDMVTPPTGPNADTNDEGLPPAHNDVNRKGVTKLIPPSKEMPFILLFCPLEQDLSQVRIAMLSKTRWLWNVEQRLCMTFMKLHI
jgi:hypothetical protein